jgi:hypothetical protein
LLYAWPFIERRVSGDRGEHHLLDRPRDRPVRTAVGVAVLTFFAVLTVAGAQDIVAQQLDTSILTVTDTLRVLLFALPVGFGLIAWRWARDLRANDPRARYAARGDPPVDPVPAEAATSEPETSEPAEDTGTAGGPASRPVARPRSRLSAMAARARDGVLGALLVALLVRAGRRARPAKRRSSQ